MCINFDEMKKSITSSNWEKIGTKFNCPDLSIFPDEIKDTLRSKEYMPFKNYYFEDESHEFKIQSLNKDNNLFFIIFGKAKNPTKSKTVTSTQQKKKFKYTTKFDTKQISIIIAVAVVLIGVVILLGPILQAIFG
jgi:hypothetical protein